MRDDRDPAAQPNKRRRLGQLLTEAGWITQEQLTQALRAQELLGGRIGTCLLEIDAIDESQLLLALAHQLGIRSARIKDLEGIPEEVYSQLDAGVAAKYKAIPFRCLGSDFYIALLDVDDQAVVDALAEKISGDLRIFVANEARVLAALESYYGIPLSERFRQLRERLDQQAIARNQHGPTEPVYEALADLTAASGVSKHGTSAAAVSETSSRPDFSAETRRDSIAEILLAYSARRFRRALLFRVQRDGIRGWMGSGSQLDSRRLAEFSIGTGEPSVLLNLKGDAPYYRGPLSPMPSHQRLADCWGGELPTDCIVLPIRIRGRLVSALLCDLGNRTIDPDEVGELESVTRDAADALGAYLRRKRRSAEDRRSSKKS